MEELDAGLLAHVFASCDATLAKAPFVVDLASEWVDSTAVLVRADVLRARAALTVRMCSVHVPPD